MKRLTLLLLMLCISKVVLAEPCYLTASWYSVQSLKAEGTFKYSKGVMANGKQFSDEAFTCSSWDYPLGARLRIRRGNSVVDVTVTDRTARRFKGKRIDLSKRAFSTIANLQQGLVQVEVERLQ